jgi:hypothetical protein
MAKGDNTISIRERLLVYGVRTPAAVACFQRVIERMKEAGGDPSSSAAPRSR